MRFLEQVFLGESFTLTVGVFGARAKPELDVSAIARCKLLPLPDRDAESFSVAVTVTWPAEINASTPRREPSPARARNRFRRMVGSLTGRFIDLIGSLELVTIRA